MTKLHPAGRIAKKLTKTLSAAATTNTTTITVPAGQVGVLYQLLVSVGVSTEANLEALLGTIDVSIKFGSTVEWQFELHPFIEHTDTTPDFHRSVDLGPWHFDFGEDGLYTGVQGDDLIVTVGSAGTGLKTLANIKYAGD